MDAAFIEDFERAFTLAETYRGRAYHAKMGAEEATSEKMKTIFERLAASYEALAAEVERLQGEDQAHGPLSPEVLEESISRLCAMDPNARLETQETLRRVFQRGT